MWADAGHRRIKKPGLQQWEATFTRAHSNGCNPGLNRKAWKRLVVLDNDATTYHRLINMSTYQN
jgi:hypothetical protein